MDQRLGFLGAKAESLKDGRDAVGEVGAKQTHGDDVKNHDKWILKSDDDHFIGINGPNPRELGIDAHGEMKDMENHESEDGETRDDHDSRRLAGLDRGLVLIGLAGLAVLPRQANGCHHVQDESHQQDDPRDPDAGTVEHLVEEFCVVIECLPPHVHQQVAAQMPSEERDQYKTGDGNNEFFPNRRGPIGVETTCEGIHSDGKTWLVSPREK